MSLQLGERSTNLEEQISRHSACYFGRVNKYLLSESHFVHPCGITIMVRFPRGKMSCPEGLCNLRLLIKWTV